jgi:hypothetical protein
MPAYPVRRGQGGTRPRAARDAQDRTPQLTRIHSPKQQGDVCAETACCKHLFQVFQIFQRYVASVLYQCSKSRSGRCTCCNGVFKCTSKMFHLFQTYVVSVHLDVAKVDLDIAYTCMLQVYVLSVFSCFVCMSQVFYLNVAYVL